MGLLGEQGFRHIDTQQAAEAFFMSRVMTTSNVVVGNHCDLGKLFDGGKSAFLVSLVFPSGKENLEESFVVSIPESHAGQDGISLFPACAGLKTFVDTLGDRSVEEFFKTWPRENSEKIYGPRPNG